MSKQRSIIWIVTAFAGTLFALTDAYAVVGRPLTPVSYAGVARRTTRRAVAANTYAAPQAVVVAPITALPAGCAQVAANGAVYYNCGGARYQPYYEGPTVVYRVVP